MARNQDTDSRALEETSALRTNSRALETHSRAPSPATTSPQARPADVAEEATPRPPRPPLPPSSAPPLHPRPGSSEVRAL